MRNVLFSPFMIGALILGTGCSNGANDKAGSVSIRCAGGQAFCLISCDLGCTQTGCSVTEIAENQRLRFVFSDRIAPGSINSSSVSIRTPTGVAPDGDLLVSDRELTFVPRVRTVNGVSTFGFQRNETYVITLPRGASGQGVRSLSGDGLTADFSCTVLASRGIQDEDQLAPTVTLVAPTQTTGVPSTPTIVLRFSELIDTGPLQGVLTTSSPINFILRGTTTSGGTLVCDTDVTGIAVEGIPQLTTETVGATNVTVVTFAAPLPLPGTSCLTINVTGDLRDLSGRSAVPASFQLITAAIPPNPITITESFQNANFQEVDQSSGRWNNGARPGLIGGDGRHGSFALSLGTAITPNEVELNTNATQIPASNTFDGLPATVADGQYFFTDFVLAAGKTLRFTGSFPPRIYVRGKLEILGTIVISGKDMPFWTPSSGPLAGQRVQDFNGRGANLAAATFVDGQPGSLGGVGGGAGGKGGNECRLNGDVESPIGSGNFIYRGQAGQDVRIVGGHAFAANAVGTGGRGSMLHPASGLSVNYLPTQMLPNTGTGLGTIRAQFAPGGGGGGFSGPGGTASVTPLGAAVFGPTPAAGVGTFDLSQPLPAGVASLDHFVVGGSGGGGGASHAFGTQQTTGLDYYVAGSGGSGGGGTMAFRAGGDVTIGVAALLESRGGRGVWINADDRLSAVNDANWGVTCPGGGGSGGSFLIQAGGNIVCAGQFDTTGGDGSRTGNVNFGSLPLTPAGFSLNSQAGAGAAGFYRLEHGGSITFTGSGIPAYVAGTHSATLLDRDDVTVQLSKWRASTSLFPPTWLRYELDVDVDGDGVVETMYTDSGSGQPANDPAGPVVIQFQGAVLNVAGTAPVTGQATSPWRFGIGNGAGPGIALDSPTGFRFILRFNRAAAPQCVVRALRVFAQS